MTQIQAYEDMSKEALIEHHRHTLQQHADDMDMLSKELAERPHAKIDRPMAIGCGRFGIGVKASTVLDAAARHYEFVTNEKREQDRIELGKLRADNFLRYGAPTDLEAYEAWLEKVSGAAAPTDPVAAQAQWVEHCNITDIPDAVLTPSGLAIKSEQADHIRDATKMVVRRTGPVVKDSLTAESPYSLSDTDRTALVELLRSIRPSYGDVGSRDVNVAAQQMRIDRAIELLTGQRCACPSGDGSLRWPCPVHPPEV